MSGGVDSSVAAALLLEQGYDVTGAFLRLGSPDGVEVAETCDTTTGKKHKQGCCSVNDADDARRVAALLGVPFYVLNFQDDFQRIVDYFVSEYNQGRTPNPCVRCNDWLKFGRLARYAEGVGADFVASGHYARLGTDPVDGLPALMRGVDHGKDQSYVLFGMSRQTMSHTLLPIGDFEKPRVRELAAERGLPTASKADSQEICFVPNQDYASLVKRRTPELVSAGDVVDGAGNTLGTHGGHQHFTVGQRKGLRLALGQPVYVVDIDPQSNRVTVGERAQLNRAGLIAREPNFLSPRAAEANDLPVHAKIRYNSPAVSARLTVTGSDAFELRFDDSQIAVTPGQAVCLYDGDVVLGGGWIQSSLK